MTVNGSNLPSLRHLTINRDSRGDVRELYRASWGLPPVVQMNRTFSRAGVIRGMHYHRKQTDVWSFVSGTARVQTYDPVTEAHEVYQVADDGQTITIPPGIAHGFQAITDCLLIYGFDREYDNSDEYGFAALGEWCGRKFWLPGEPIMSERDKAAAPLAAFLATL